MLHAAFLLVFMLVAAPLASYIPLAALAGVLAVVAWNMAEKEELWNLLRGSRGDAVVVIVTFLLVVFRDLTEGIVAGAAIGGAVFIRRMSDATQVEEHDDYRPADVSTAERVVWRLRGPWFFGAAARLGSVLERIADHPREVVIDMTDVPFIDSSGARAFELLAHKVARGGGQLCLTGARPEVVRALGAQGAGAPRVRFAADLAALGPPPSER
jgi:SulP family sulfate permease